VRRQLPGLLSHFLRSCHPHRNIDTCSSKGFQPPIIQGEELSIAFKDANGWDIRWVEASTLEFLCQIIERSPIPESGFNACLAESDALGIQQLYALPMVLRQ
jgi:hypothetical protein